MRPGAIDYTLEEFSRQVEAVRTKTSQEHAQADARRADLRQQLERLTTAVAETGHSTFLLQAIAERERELAAVEHVLKAGAKDSHSDVEQLRRFAVEKLRELPELLSADVSRAQQNSHVT